MNFQRLLILRYLRSRRGFISVVSGFSLAGIVVGVAALIVVMAVMTGFREELLNRILGVAGHATLGAAELSYPQAKSIQKLLENHEEVISAQPFIQGQAMIVASGRASGAIIRAIDFYQAEKPQENNLLLDNLKVGSKENLLKPRRVAIGQTMARTLGLGVGSTLTLLSPQGTHTIAGFIPRMQKYKVAAIFKIGMHMYDSGWLYMSIKDAQKFFAMNNLVTGLDLRITTPDSIDIIQENLLDEAKKITKTPPYIITWKDNNSQFFEALQVERIAMFLILSLIVLVAAFNIITGQTMLVNDKTADIAIIRTMGARRRDILSIFFLNGTLLGAIGTAVGVGLGLLILHYLQPIIKFMENMFNVAIFSGEAYFLDKLPATIVLDDIIAVALLSIALSMLASLYPAWRAAMLDPVEILRNE